MRTDAETNQLTASDLHAADADAVKLARGQLNVGLADVTKKDRVRALASTGCLAI